MKGIRALPTIGRRGETEAQARAAASWQARALLATKGNQTQLGTILIAVLGKAASHPPRIVSNAVINREGVVMAGFQPRGSKSVADTGIAAICTAEELTENFRGLADHLRLNDNDRTDMMRRVREWVNRDERVVTDLGDTDDRKIPK